MKKLFFIAAIAVAVVMASCTKETEVNQGSEELNGDTYVTFSFDFVNPVTKGLGDFNAPEVNEDDAGNLRIATGDLNVLIFSATTNVLENIVPVPAGPTTSVTALVKAGTKKIFVLANMGVSGANHVNQKLVKVAFTPTFSTSAVTVAGATPSLAVGMTIADFYAYAFNAGTPQVWSVDKNLANRAGWNLLPLSSNVDATHGLPMTNSNFATFTLKPNVSEAEANANVTSSEDAGNTNNRFLIKLDYLGAKARLAIINNIPQNNAKWGKADITFPKYGIKNLAKLTSLIQQDPSNDLRDGQSIYYNMGDWGITSTMTDQQIQALFDPHFDQAMNASATVQPAASFNAAKALTTSYIYVPENNNEKGNFLPRAQSSFYALNVTYKPLRIVKDATWDPNLLGVNQGGFEFTIDNYAGAASVMDGGNKHIWVEAEIKDSKGEGTFYFANMQLYADVVWMKTYGKDITDPAYTSSAALALVWDGTKFLASAKQYTDAQSWYRVDIGETVGTKTNYGVLRGFAYTAFVNDIQGPGEPSEGDLFKDPGKPVEDYETYINVSIEAKGWTKVGMETPVGGGN